MPLHLLLWHILLPSLLDLAFFFFYCLFADTTAECIEFRKRVCQYCAPQPTTALSLLNETTANVDPSSWSEANRMRYLPTGLVPLDERLKGGFRVGTLTELVGQAGSGKTQMAMQAIVMAATAQDFDIAGPAFHAPIAFAQRARPTLWADG